MLVEACYHDRDRVRAVIANTDGTDDGGDDDDDDADADDAMMLLLRAMSR